MSTITAVRESQVVTALPTHRAYLTGLNSLRGLAALLVCLYHFTNGALPKVVVPTTQWLFARGTLGVEVFFVISGFIIPYSLVGKNHQARGILAYLKKRILRINPPAYVVLTLTIGQAFFIDKIIQHGTKYTHAITGPSLLHNFLFTIPYTHYTWIVGVLWTLAIEFQFYLFVGVLFTGLFERKSVGVFVSVYLAVAALYYFFPAQDSFLQYGALFALGGVALLWQQQRLSRLLYGGLLMLFSGLLYWQLGAYVAAAGLLTALALNSLQVQVPGLGFLGKISYSFYLLHILVGTSCEFFLVKVIQPTSDANKLFITLLAIVAAIGSSYIFYRFVEQPCMRLAARQG